MVFGRQVRRRAGERERVEQLDGFAAYTPGAGAFSGVAGIGEETTEGGAEAIGRRGNEGFAGADIACDLGSITCFDENRPLEVQERGASRKVVAERSKGVEEGVVQGGMGVVIVDRMVDEFGHVQARVMRVQRAAEIRELLEEIPFGKQRHVG